MPIFKRPKPPDDGPPSDEKVAEQMRYLAGVFIQATASVGDTFAFDTESALRLDGRRSLVSRRQAPDDAGLYDWMR
jgi:hypothetical protein